MPAAPQKDGLQAAGVWIIDGQQVVELQATLAGRLDPSEERPGLPVVDEAGGRRAAAVMQYGERATRSSPAAVR